MSTELQRADDEHPEPLIDMRGTVTLGTTMALLSEAAVLISRAAIDADRQRYWAEEILRRVPWALNVDLHSAIRSIAGATHNQWWKLELGEVLDEVRAAVTLRMKKERVALGTDRQIPASTQTREVVTAHAKIVREVMGDFIAGKIDAASMEGEARRRMDAIAGDRK